jgi:hypothetical protein
MQQCYLAFEGQPHSEQKTRNITPTVSDEGVSDLLCSPFRDARSGGPTFS